MQQELEVLANVNHPNIMRIYELLEDKVNSIHLDFIFYASVFLVILFYHLPPKIILLLHKLVLLVWLILKFKDYKF